MNALRVRRGFQKVVRLYRVEILQDGRDVEQIASFRKREFFVEYFAFAKLVEDLKRGGFRSKPVFAGLERRSRVESSSGQKGPARAYDTVTCQQVADRARRHSMLHFHKGLVSEAP